MLRAFLKSPTGKAILILTVCLLLWNGWLSWAAPRKLAPEVAPALKATTTVDLAVELNFPPERFHILTFQTVGRVTGSKENTVELRGVDPKSILRLARYYWVKRISVLPAPQF